ncbi:MAG TPA: DUF4242 domain-containing protein [Kofleriaceae bacterium]|nr:DUF4242 domain-containing protein [Kofleriaceae bacterium]
MPIFMVDRTFSPALSEADFAAGGRALQPCIDERHVQWLGSNLAADGSRSVCMYEAADAERIREANRVAGVPFDRVWEARMYRP